MAETDLHAKQQQQLRELAGRRTELVGELRKLQEEAAKKQELLIRIEGALEGAALLGIELEEEAPEAPAPNEAPSL